ncbi:phosphohydrolase [Ideonella sp. 4Y16]|uniref:Phosphohydrolase n=1 Tax=Ideonella alba TaxID=2824118 RepID=A0A941BH62_9BURK|nr:HD domain-containing phosphohydrolase [Ideonella alba]MBQ0931278.1 phosphohydrolase [Ideonella alba]MBQ0945134.1 phosphohydrolase [Ideonella alba]
MSVIRQPLSEVLDLLVVGTALPFHVLDPHERRLLAEGHVVVSEAQLEALIARGAWVDRAVADAVRAQRQQDQAAVAAPQRVPTLFDRWEEMIWQLDGLLRQVLAGQPGQEAALLWLAERLIERVDRHVDVALFMVVRPPDPRFALYALQHAQHTAVVGLLLSRHLGWDGPTARRLVAAAMTMNVSTLELQAQMAVQTDPPTTRQRELIRAHPLASETLLRRAGVTDEAWLQAVREHHERPDGGGYPAGLTQVCELAHALRTADVFTAKISARAIRQALPIQVAAKQLFQEEKGGPMATGIIKQLGLYPPGDLVQLKSGEIAVVTHRGPNATTPLVATITNTQGQPVAATLARNSADAAYAITGPVLDRKGLPRVPAERVYGLIPA